MAVNVRVPGPLRRRTAGSSQVEVEGGTVAAALADLEVRFPGFRDRLYDDGGKLRQVINIYVNDADIRFGGGWTPGRRGRRHLDRPGGRRRLTQGLVPLRATDRLTGAGRGCWAGPRPEPA